MKNKLLSKDIFDIKFVLIKESTNYQRLIKKYPRLTHINESRQMKVDRLNELIEKLTKLEQEERV